MAFFDKGIELSDALESEFVHEIDLVRFGEVLRVTDRVRVRATLVRRVTG